MKLKEQTKRKLDELGPEALSRVYDLVMELRRAAEPEVGKTIGEEYLKVREALRPCEGALSDDVSMERKDRT